MQSTSTMSTTAKHIRHRLRRRQRHSKRAATRVKRVKRGGMKLELTSRADLKIKKKMYGILFSPHMQSSVPLGLQIQEILQSPDCQMDVTEMKTMCQIVDRYAYDEYDKLSRSLFWFESPETILVQGCQAEMDLKTSIAEIIEQVNAIQTTTHHMPALELMANFKCDAPDFANKIMNLNVAFHEKDARRAYVYHQGIPANGITSAIHELVHSSIVPQIKSIQKSFQVKLIILEMVRDVALPQMIDYYEKGYEGLPEFLVNGDPAEFKKNMDAFKRYLDVTITQQKHIMGDDVITTQMLHEISHLSLPRSVLQQLPTRSLKLAPPPAAIKELIPELLNYTPSQHKRQSLITNSALTKFLADRLTGDRHQTTPFKNAQQARRVIGRRHEFNPDKDDDHVPHTGPMVEID